MSTSTFEMNIAGNVRIYNRAFYASDAGIDYFYSLGEFYTELPDSAGVMDSRNQGLNLDGDYFQVTWKRKITGAVSPIKYEFEIKSIGISPNFPANGRVAIEAIIEIEEAKSEKQEESPSLPSPPTSEAGKPVKNIISWREIF